MEYYIIAIVTIGAYIIVVSTALLFEYGSKNRYVYQRLVNKLRAVIIHKSTESTHKKR